jgi:1,4-dihydroxy-6-naphthoate synthase
VLDDVEALNAMAEAEALDVAKVSYHAAATCRPLGATAERRRARPRRRPAGRDARAPERPSGPNRRRPGRRTTAMLLLSLAFGGGRDHVLRYDRIMPAVAAGEVDAGLIIHESRFTYPDHGLVCHLDLGAWWEARSGHLIPLGAIAVRRGLPDAVHRELARAVHASVSAAMADPAASEPFIAQHAQEMDPEVRRRHVELYVNRWSAAADGLAPLPPTDLYVDWRPAAKGAAA